MLESLHNGMSMFVKAIRYWRNNNGIFNLLAVAFCVFTILVLWTSVNYHHSHADNVEIKVSNFQIWSNAIFNATSSISAKKDTAAELLSIDDFLSNIYAHIEQIPDTRPSHCKTTTLADIGISTKVSIVIDAINHQVEDLKHTIASLLQHTQRALISDLVIVGSDATLQHITADLERQIQTVWPLTLILSGGSSKSHALLKATRATKGNLLVFIENGVICNKNWLEPLIDTLMKEPTTIAVPHLDNMNSGQTMEYSGTADTLAPTFSWAFDVWMAHHNSLNLPINSPSVHIPILRNDIFAVQKKFLESIGTLDYTLDDPTAMAIELSFRTWLCGGSIHIVPCSRVGVTGVGQTLKIIDRTSIKYIAELWLGSYKELVYKNTGVVTPEDSHESVQKVQERLFDFSKIQLQCKPFDFYIRNIAKDIGLHTTRTSVKHGLLKSASGLCARASAHFKDNRIELGRCKPSYYQLHPADMSFYLNEDGQIVLRGKCLTVQQNAYVTLQPCKMNDHGQIWSYSSLDYTLVNSWTGECACQVVDPEGTDSPIAHHKVIMVAECSQLLMNAMDTVRWSFEPQI